MPTATRSDPASTRLQVLAIHTMDEMNPVISRILDAMVQIGYSEKDCFGARLSLEEAIVNALRHGNRGDPLKTVHIRFAVSDRQIVAEVEDEGPGFNPYAIPNPLAPENLERPGGRGVFLMRHYMTTVHFNDRGNCVHMCKIR